MGKTNGVIEVKNNVFWTGSLDYDIRVFDIVMRTEYGTTYNAYVVKGENKTALIEISKDSFFEEYIERVKEVCNVEEIDYIIVNHTEPDHSGSLAKLLKLAKKAVVCGSMSAIKFAKEITNMDFKSRIVKEGDTIDLGGKTLKFIMTPFLHWPDSMYTYCIEDEILFTCDSFGCHFCSPEIFDDKIDRDFLDAYKYYFDVIMGPFKSFVLQALDKIKDLKIDIICTGHGPVLRKNPQKYIELYREWATVVKNDKLLVVIPYVTAYGYTEIIATEIANAIKSTNKADVKLYNIMESEREEIVAQMNNADGILFGSPTIIGDTLPPIWALLSELNPIIHKGKSAAAFGSYGWSGEAVGFIEERLKQLKFKLPMKGLKINFKPSEEQLKLAHDFGIKFAESL